MDRIKENIGICIAALFAANASVLSLIKTGARIFINKEDVTDEWSASMRRQNEQYKRRLLDL